MLEYCMHRKQHIKDINITYLLPINLPVVTMWCLKHCHTDRCIATELIRFHQIHSELPFIFDYLSIIQICILGADCIT